MKVDYESGIVSHTRNMENKYSFMGKTILDIGCGDGEMVKRIAREYSPKYITGIDMSLRKREEKTENYSLISNVDARKLPFEDNSFDFIYTISTFEHINGVAEVLAEVRRVLKPRGKFYTNFCPLWTSVCGHHVYSHGEALREGMDKDKEVVEAVPPWGHLYMSEEEMREHLQKTDIPEKRISAILRYIYHLNDINRRTASETRNDFIQSGMIIRKYCERVSFSRQWALDKTGKSELTDDILRRIKQTKYKIEDIGIVFMSAELEKYENLQSIDKERI